MSVTYDSLISDILKQHLKLGQCMINNKRCVAIYIYIMKSKDKNMVIFHQYYKYDNWFDYMYCIHVCLLLNYNND